MLRKCGWLIVPTPDRNHPESMWQSSCQKNLQAEATQLTLTGTVRVNLYMSKKN